MRRFSLFGGLLFCFLGLSLVAGCDSEDATTNPAQKNEGSFSDPVFQGALGAYESTDEFGGMMWDFTIELMDTVFNDPAHPAPFKASHTSYSLAAAADSFLHTYHSNSQYWYFYLSHEETGGLEGDTLVLVIEDSIQFLHGSTPAQWPDSSLLTGVKNGVLLTISATGGFGSVTADQNVTVMGEIVEEGDVTLNGTQGFDVNFSDEQSSCDFSMDLNSTATSIEMNLTEMNNDGCPSSGTLVCAGTIALECTGDTAFAFSDTWTITQTFQGDSVSVVFENSTTRWSFTEACGGQGGAASPLERAVAFFKER